MTRAFEFSDVGGWLKGLGCILGYFYFAAPGFAGDDFKDRPNFVFILLDDAGWGDFGCYGNPVAYTPNVDRLAKEGRRFAHFYVNSPVCAPTRVAFLTGMFPSRLAVHHVNWGNERWGMPAAVSEDTVWLQQVLADHGYRTAHFGKWHLGDRRDGPNPSDIGFHAHRTNVSTGPGWQRTNEWIPIGESQIVDEAIDFIKENRDQPFYVNVHTLHPHTPIFPSREQMDIEPYADWDPPGFGGQTLPVDTPMRQYYATLSETDRQIGRLLDTLDELGLADNTVIVFTSDNGPEYLNIRFNASVGNPGPFRGLKRSLYEGGIRMPFIVRWPAGVPAGGVDNSSVLSGTDFFSTVLDIAGIEFDTSYQDGESVKDIFMGTERERSRPLLWEMRFRQGSYSPIIRSPMLALREGPWKFLMNPDLSRVELYNVAENSLEVNCHAHAHPDLVERFTEILLEFHHSLPEGPIDPMAGEVDYLWFTWPQPYD